MQKEWSAKWVWANEAYDIRNKYLYGRKQFNIPTNVEKIVIRVSADSRYKLWINGRYVSRGPARCYPWKQSFDTVNILPYLKIGKNVMAIMVHQYGESTFSYIHRWRAGFIVDGDILLKNGSCINIDTDSSWKVKDVNAYKRNTKRTSVQTGFQEVFDSRLEEISWNKANFNDDNWENATIVGPIYTLPWESMEERGIPMLRECTVNAKQIVAQYIGKNHKDYLDSSKLSDVLYEEKLHKTQKILFKNQENVLKPNKTVTTILPNEENKFSSMLIDFGKEVSGCLQLKINKADGGEIFDFVYAEKIEDSKPLIHPPNKGSKVAFMDRYITKKGIQEFETFSFRGLRYLLLVARCVRRPVEIEYIGLNSIEYPVSEIGDFECSDKLLNKIWDVGKYTVRKCMSDAYVDCPWREQTQWLSDMMIQSLVNYYTFGDPYLIRRGLKQFAQSQTFEGLLFGIAPSDRYRCINPDYNLIWFISIHNYYLFTGDKSLLKECYPVMLRILDFFQKHAGKKYLLGPTPRYWLFLDWAKLDKKHLSATFNMLYLLALETAIKIFKIIGKDSKNLSQQYLKLKKAIEKHFWSKDKNLWIEAFDSDSNKQIDQISQHSNSLAVLSGLKYTEEVKKAILEGIYNPKTQIMTASPYFYFYIIWALMKIGREREVVDCIKGKWGDMLRKDATTWWENWNAGNDVLWSCCHGWSAHPTYFLSKHVLGVHPISAGWRKFQFSPKFLNLNYVKGKVPTPSGLIEVEWKRKNKYIDIKLTVPKGLKAEIDIKGCPKKIAGTGITRLRCN
ncbi:family 78 glycoside hydrolase catalytic domain [bacterium]|nr:family 78 glycoside hydrolase catalytic domain [bacterium]